MEAREIIQHLEQTFAGDIVSASDEGCFPFLVVKPERLKPVLSYCVHDPAMRFDFLECITGVDGEQEITIIYHLFSTAISHRINVKTLLNRHEPTVASVTGLWRAANAYELEAAELLGVTFEGHPQPRRLLLPEDWVGHPLRKDYVYPEEYHGIEHRRAPLRKEHVRP